MVDRSSIDFDEVEGMLRQWILHEKFASYDPYDGLSCSMVWPLVKHNRLLARMWTQMIKRSPWNLRPLLGIQKRVLSKTFSDLASAMVVRHRMEHPDARAEAERFLELLKQEIRPGYAGPCWALSTRYVTRHTYSLGQDPNLFWTINAANAFLDAYEVWGDEEHLRIARGTIDFVIQDLGYVEEPAGDVWFRYFVGHDAAVYNVAALMGALLIRVATHTGETSLTSLGERAIGFVLRHQNANGSWYYARGATGSWIDGFHTGYILESCLQVHGLQGGKELSSALQRGTEFYERHLFEPNGLPRYFAGQLYPIDVQNAAQAIQTLSKLAMYDRRFASQARKTATAVSDVLFRQQTPSSGYFMTSKGRFFDNRIPMIRWGQAPMLLAFEFLLLMDQRLKNPK